MSDTFRNLNGIDKAGQAPAWERPLNPKQTAKANPVQDTKAQTTYPKPARKNGGDGLQAVDKDGSY